MLKPAPQTPYVVIWYPGGERVLAAPVTERPKPPKGAVALVYPDRAEALRACIGESMAGIQQKLSEAQQNSSAKPKYPRILGLDPGFANLGYSVVELRPNGTIWALDMGVLHTEKADKKTNVRASDDNSRRSRDLARALTGLISKYDVSMLCLEAMSFPRNAGAAAKMSRAWGVVDTLSELLDLPMAQATPQEIKKAVVGRKDATKEEVEAALAQSFVGNTGLAAARVKPKDREHCFDALGSIVACLPHDTMRLLAKQASLLEDGT